MKRIIVAAMCLIAGLAWADDIVPTDFKPIETKYVLRGESVNDPLPGEKIDRVALWMHGDGAKRIYDAMPDKPELMCGGEVLWKQAGGLSCGKTGQDYSCAVAIVLKSGETSAAMDC